MAAVTLAIIAMYCVKNRLLYHSLTPPGAKIAPFLRTYSDLYIYPPRLLTWNVLLTQKLSKLYILASFRQSWLAFWSISFVPMQVLFLCVCPISLFFVILYRKFQRIDIIWFLLPLLPLGIVYTSPIVFSARRALHPLLPIVILAGTVSMD